MAKTIGIIGQTQYKTLPDARVSDIEIDAWRAAYAQVFSEIGALPFLIPVGPAHLAASYVENVDAIVLAGGQDVHPSAYGQTPQPTGVYDTRRDAFELAVISAALAMEKPILAICRGSQILNVALGGTLIQDIPTQVPNAISHDQKPQAWDKPTHVIDIDGGLLRKLYGTTLKTNSFHHQAIAQLAPGLTKTAQTVDGIIEGYEDPRRRLFAVQFHPEFSFATYPEFSALFKDFVAQI